MCVCVCVCVCVYHFIQSFEKHCLSLFNQSVTNCGFRRLVRYNLYKKRLEYDMAQML